MPGHRFNITVEALSDRQGNPVEKAPLSFEVTNHDDILEIVKRIRARDNLNFSRAERGLRRGVETVLRSDDRKPQTPGVRSAARGV